MVSASGRPSIRIWSVAPSFEMLVYGAVYVWPDGVVSVTKVFVDCEIWPALIVTSVVAEPSGRGW